MKWLLVWIILAPDGYYARVSQYTYDDEISCLRAIQKQGAKDDRHLVCVSVPPKSGGTT